MTKQTWNINDSSSFHICMNMINNRLVFKIINGYKLELQTTETLKLLGSTKKVIEKKKKNGESLPSLQVAEVFLVLYNLVDNEHHQKFKALYPFSLTTKCRTL